MKKGSMQSDSFVCFFYVSAVCYWCLRCPFVDLFGAIYFPSQDSNRYQEARAMALEAGFYVDVALRQLVCLVFGVFFVVQVRRAQAAAKNKKTKDKGGPLAIFGLTTNAANLAVLLAGLSNLTNFLASLDPCGKFGVLDRDVRYSMFVIPGLYFAWCSGLIASYHYVTLLTQLVRFSGSRAGKLDASKLASILKYVRYLLQFDMFVLFWLCGTCCVLRQVGIHTMSTTLLNRHTYPYAIGAIICITSIFFVFLVTCLKLQSILSEAIIFGEIQKNSVTDLVKARTRVRRSLGVAFVFMVFVNAVHAGPFFNPYYPADEPYPLCSEIPTFNFAYSARVVNTMCKWTDGFNNNEAVYDFYSYFVAGFGTWTVGIFVYVVTWRTNRSAAVTNTPTVANKGVTLHHKQSVFTTVNNNNNNNTTRTGRASVMKSTIGIGNNNNQVHNSGHGSILLSPSLPPSRNDLMSVTATSSSSMQARSTSNGTIAIQVQSIAENDDAVQ
jgi:hypothetical protein